MTHAPPPTHTRVQAHTPTSQNDTYMQAGRGFATEAQPQDDVRAHNPADAPGGGDLGGAVGVGMVGLALLAAPASADEAAQTVRLVLHAQIRQHRGDVVLVTHTIPLPAHQVKVAFFFLFFFGSTVGC